ncbi:MAG: hypothetical protein EPO21_20945 [Chloroflexota bacterium]|nr:MAG: hypothetical protein EPO21_20945 [Chloroflexota bacterium]
MKVRGNLKPADVEEEDSAIKGKVVVTLALLMGLVTVLAAGCTGELGKAPVAQAAIAQADVPRIGNPQLPEGDLAALAAGNVFVARAQRAVLQQCRRLASLTAERPLGLWD